MAVKERLLISFVALLAGCVALVANEAHSLHERKKELLTRWDRVGGSIQELAGLAPNFVHLGKSFAIDRGDLLTGISRVRLSLASELKSAPKSFSPWSAAVLEQADQLAAMNQELASHLGGLGSSRLPSQHLRALSDQWKLRLSAYESAKAGFRLKLEECRRIQRTWPGAVTLLWERL